VISVVLLAVTAVAAGSSSTTLPAGHPRIDPDHGGAGGTTAAGPAFFRPPPDTADEDTALAPGTIRVELRDFANNVLPNHGVELGILQQSVAKGESHKHLAATTGPDGSTTFTSLEPAGNIAYRVSVHEGDAAFAAKPFQLGHDHGMHVVLHVYPPTSDLTRGALIITRSIIYIEMKEDRIQLQQRIDVFNGSPVAWVPKDVVLKLPSDFTAVTGMQQMSDIGVDAVPEQGVRLHGTFGPGENPVVFSWPLPYGGESSVDFEAGLPPNVGQLIVRAAAATGMKLEVPGFRPAISQVSEEGQRELVTGKQIQEGDAPIRKVHISIRDLPTPGPARFIATALAAIGILAGVYVARRPRPPKVSGKRDRTRLLQEFEELEKAHAQGDIGPKTYERARRELIDELAAVLATATHPIKAG
jgi:hypothetical protein